MQRAALRDIHSPRVVQGAEDIDRTTLGVGVGTGQPRSTVSRLRSSSSQTKCANGFKDGMETDVDCGGSCRTRCTVGMRCKRNADCFSFKCIANTCIEKTVFIRRLSTNATSENNTNTSLVNASSLSNATNQTPAKCYIKQCDRHDRQCECYRSKCYKLECHIKQYDGCDR